MTLPDGSTRQWTYDAQGRLTGCTDELGRQTLYGVASESGQVLSVRQVVGQVDSTENGQTDDVVTTLAYTASSANPGAPPAGLVAAVSDPLGRVTSYQYDSFGQLTGVTYAVGTADEASVGFEYDAAGRVLAKVDELGRRTQFGYDGSGRVTSVTQPDSDGSGPLGSPVTSYQYNARGELVRQTDPLGRVVEYAYDSFGRVTSESKPDHDWDGQLTVTTMTYNAAGQLASVTDPLGRVTSYGYDPLGRASSVTLPDPDGPSPEGSQSSPVTQTAYDALGRVTQSTDALGNVTSYTYQNFGRRVIVTGPDPDGAGPLSAPVTTLDYDAAGNLISQVDPLGGTSTFAYDALGRKVTETGPDPDGSGSLAAPVTTFAYDKAGNLVSVTDALGHITQYAYDARNRRTSILDAEDGVTEFAYDAVGNLVSLTDPVGNTTTWVYDGLNRIIEETNELGYTRHFSYDAAGRQTERIDRLGRVITYSYDALDNLVMEIWYANETDAAAYENATNVMYYQYDAAGRLVAESDSYSSYTYSYDALDRCTSETIANPGGPTVVLTSEYAAMSPLPPGEGQGVRALRTSLSATINGTADFHRTYAYDDLGQMTQIVQTGQSGGNTVASIRIDLSYDDTGRFQSITRYQDSHLVATSAYAYDQQGHLTAITHAQGSTTLAAYTWTYDSAGRLTDVSSPDGSVHYSYDDTSQLTGADYGEGSSQSDETYSWDANGNPTTTGYIVGPNNQLLSDGTYRYEYDAEGSRTAKYIWTDADTDGQVDAGERSDITEYAWDNRNRLVRVTERATEGGALTKAVDYVYDTHNRWIARTFDLDGDGSQSSDTTRFVYDGSQILLQFDTSNSLTHRYLWGPAVDQILADEQVTSPSAPGDVLWPLTDHLNTVRDLAVYDAQQDLTTIANHRTYDSFGKITSETNAVIDHLFAFTGRAFDATTGLQNNLNRWYDAATGRWASQDPLGFAGADVNPSRYVGNSPTNYTDPYGLKPWEGIAKILGKKWSKETCERAGKRLATELLDVLKNQRPDSQKAQEIIRALKKMGWVEETLGKGSHQGQGMILREVVDGKLTDTFLQWHPGGGHHGPDPYWKFTSTESGKLRTVGGTVGAIAIMLIPGAEQAAAGDYNGGARQFVYEASPLGWGSWVTAYWSWLFDWASADIEAAKRDKIKF